MLKNPKVKACFVALLSMWKPVKIKRKGRAFVGIGYRFSRLLSHFFDVRYSRRGRIWIELRKRK